MGKGLIVSGGEEGLYTVELLHNRDRIEAELQFLAGLLTELQAEVDALSAERDGLVAQRNAIATEIDTAIANADEGEIPDVEALLVELARVSAQIQQQDVRIAMPRGRMLEANKRKEALESVPEDPQQQAWCADYTEDLTGEVATVEVPAEGVVGQFATWRRVQIRPGYSGRATYNAARDGQMFHREGQVGYQAYFNAAILPGVQRWKPQYRIGTITAIDLDADTCSVDVVSEFSSAQDLFINQGFALSGVPIDYMECDSAVFEVGDRVLIEFQERNWSSPKVIGFETNPKPCTFLAAYPINYRVGSGSAISNDGECYPPFPSGITYHFGWLTTGEVLLSRTPLLFYDKTGMDSLLAASHWSTVEVDRGQRRTVGLGVHIASESEILAAIPSDLAVLRYQRNILTGNCESTSFLRNNQIKRMYQMDDEGVIAPGVYPTWPIDFDATLTGNNVSVAYRYRTSTDAAYYQSGDFGFFYCSEEMNEPSQFDLGEVATLATFPDIDGFEAARVIKTIPGYARTLPEFVIGSGYNGRADVVDQLHIVVEYIPKTV